MEFWPTDFRADNSLLSKRRRSGKEVYSLVGQTLDVGSLGAAALSSENSTFEWKTLVQPPGKNILRQIGESIELLPPTRPPQPATHQMSPQEKAAQAIHFLRTHYPDVDVSLDLIQEIQAREDEFKHYDPYQGNVIAQLAFLNRKRERVLDFIALPVGATGAELNVFPIRETRNSPSLDFIPIAHPLLNFETPIRQLETFPRCSITENYSLLVARTYGSVSVLKVGINKEDSTTHPLSAEILHSFSSMETGGHQVVDINCGGFGHTNGKILLVNNIGGVFLSSIDGEVNAIASPACSSDSGTMNKFWRIGWADMTTYIRASDKGAHLFDLRTPDILPTDLFHLTDPKEYITSFESTPTQSLQLGFSTTSRLLLFDVRHMRQPVISLSHHRFFDKTLRLKSFKMDGAMWHTLSSSRNRLVTVYNTISSLDSVQLRGMHSILPSSFKVDLPIIGSHVFQKSSNLSGSFISYVQLSSRGSLWSTDITATSRVQQDSEEETRFLNRVNNEAMEELVEKSKAMSSHLSEEVESESTEADLSAVYQKIAQVRKETKPESENFYRVLDGLTSFWQDTDIPVDHMLTTFDIAFRSGQEPRHPLRADFLTGSALNCPRGLAGLLNDRLPTAQLMGTAPWSFDLASLSPELVPDAAIPPQQLLDRLTEEAVSHETTSDNIKYAVEAAQELVLDLGLSRHIYAPRKFSQFPADSDTDALLEATQALSLDSPTIPASHFAYLEPVATDTFEEGKDKPEETFELLPGVRLLLSEWKAGTRPEDYVFSDWYGASRDDPSAEREPRVADKRFEPSQPQSSQVPPVVLSRPPPVVITQTTTGPPVIKTHTRRSSPTLLQRSLYPIREIGGSQVDIPMTQGSVTHDDQYPNTQPLPGPFGGKLDFSKKKTVKKRIGGF